MVAPASPLSSRSGRAALAVRRVAGVSAVTQAFASSPLRVLAPRSRGPSVWAYLSSLGGGYLAGDQTELEITVHDEACCFFSTQSLTKVYRNPTGLACGHRTSAQVNAGALLVFAPDPVQAFAGSHYRQRQSWQLAPGASLVLLDWFTSGRAARGERWQFGSFESRNDLTIAGEPSLIDSVRLHASDGPIGAPHRTGRYHCFATLVLVGPKLAHRVDTILAQERDRPLQPAAPITCAASPIRGGALVRLAGEAVELVAQAIRNRLGPLSQWLGDDPWERKW